MDERQIQNTLWRSMQGAKIVVPNFTPASWFECDLFSVSTAGYWTEHEVKLSVADFKADARKFGGFWRDRKEDDPPGFGSRIRENLTKHHLLGQRDERGPSIYWYVLSESVAAAVEIPEWAGLKIAYQASKNHLRVKVEKQAPKLHRVKASERLIEQAMVACYWRYWRARVYRNVVEPKE